MGSFRYLLAVLVLLCVPAFATEHSIKGSAKAVDGDTLDFQGVLVDLYGIDAPEERQTCSRGGENWSCGEDAKDALAALIEGKQVDCRSIGFSEVDRLVAMCTIDDLDLALTMIESGLSTASPGNRPAYIAAEKLRKTHKIGIWSSAFEPPAKWRAANPVLTREREVRRARSSINPPRSQISERVYRNHFGCAIKGNRSRRGDWIYHLPGMHYYERTRPEELFCTESQARKAGYRRSKA